MNEHFSIVGLGLDRVMHSSYETGIWKGKEHLSQPFYLPVHFVFSASGLRVGEWKGKNGEMQ